MCLRKLGQVAEAVVIFRQLLAYPAVLKSHVNIASNLIEALMELHKYDEAMSTLKLFEGLIALAWLLSGCA